MRMSSTSFRTSVKASVDLCLSILLVQLSNGMSLTDFTHATETTFPANDLLKGTRFTFHIVKT